MPARVGPESGEELAIFQKWVPARGAAVRTAEPGGTNALVRPRRRGLARDQGAKNRNQETWAPATPSPQPAEAPVKSERAVPHRSYLRFGPWSRQKKKKARGHLPRHGRRRGQVDG